MPIRDSSKHRVSVIVPYFNGERYIGQALDSVLNQSLLPYEVIVINDGSNEAGLKALRKYEGRIIRIDQENAGTAAARNTGVDASTGDLLAFLDQDDFWEQSKLEKQVRLLAANPRLQVVWGGVQQFISPELPEAFKKRYRCQKDPMVGYLPSAMLVRKIAFFEVGYFNTKWRLGEWADWCTRCRQELPESEHITEVVAYRRIHEGNKGITMANDRKEYIELVRENLKRKRAR